MNCKDRGFYIGTIVRHFKGKFYRIEGIAEHTETKEMFVVYRQLYPPFRLYARPEEMFCSEVDHEKYPNENQLYRMSKVTEAHR